MKAFPIRITRTYNGANTFSTINAPSYAVALKECRQLELRFRQLGDSVRIIILKDME